MGVDSGCCPSDGTLQGFGGETKSVYFKALDSFSESIMFLFFTLQIAHYRPNECRIQDFKCRKQIIW